MISKIQALIDNKLIRYILVGGISYLIELGFLYLLIVLGFDQIIAVAISFWCGLVISFVLQKIFAFSNKEKTVKKLAWQSGIYALLVGINYLFTLLMVAIASPHIGLLIARTAALFITTLWNYFIYKKIIFKEVK